MRHGRRITAVIAAAAALALSACSGQTDPATNVDHDSATLNGHGRCEPGDDRGRFRFEIRDVALTQTFTPISDWGGLVCDDDNFPAGDHAISGATGDVLKSDTLYEFRVSYKFEKDQSVVWADSNGDPLGTNYDSFRTSTSPPPTGGKTGLGFWLNDAEIAALPTSGTPYQNTLVDAYAYTGSVNLSNQDENQDINHLAQAIIGKRLNDQTRLNEVRASCVSSRGSTAGGRVLGISRNLPPFIAGCAIAGVNDSAFRSWVAGIRNEQGHECNGRADSILECYRDRPNNWGTMAGGALAAANSYLQDTAALNDIAETYQDFLGRKTRAQGASFVWTSPAEGYDCGGTLTTTHGITPEGCTKSGVNLSGAVPDDERRCGAFTSPPCTGATYPWETRQGIVVEAVILQRAGFPVSSWQNNATDRMYDYMQRYHLSTLDSEDQWQTWLDRCLDGSTALPLSDGDQDGKNMGHTEYTHRSTTTCA